MIGRALRPDQRVGLLMAAGVLLLFLTLLVSVVLPVTDPALDVEATERAKAVAREERGARVFRGEGCWYCHTQQARSVKTDTGLGEPLKAGDYELQRPSVLGAERVGPDLAHVGARYEKSGDIVQLLRDPRAGGRRSSMPSYSYLSKADLDALARYLLASK